MKFITYLKIWAVVVIASAFISIYVATLLNCLGAAGALICKDKLK